MNVGIVIGSNSFIRRSSKSGKEFSGYELAVLNSTSPVGYEGIPVVTLTAFSSALGDYVPHIGDGIRYHTYFQNGRAVVAFVIPEPSADDRKLTSLMDYIEFT